MMNDKTLTVDKKRYLMNSVQRWRTLDDYDHDTDLKWWDKGCRRCGAHLVPGERLICVGCRAAIDRMMAAYAAVCQ